MPPHLHPRSRTTSSLFATTVLASFLVVGLPHVLPCPAPRVKHADSETYIAADGTRRRRRRRAQETAEVRDGMAQFEGSGSGGEGDTYEQQQQQQQQQLRVASRSKSRVGNTDGDADEARATRTPSRRERECPVPKPGGVIGELMGFRNGEKSSSSSKTDRGNTAPPPRGDDET